MSEQRTLAELINSRKAAGNLSLRAMSRRAAAKGTPISPSALSAYAIGKSTNWPSASTREALANALDVPVEQIVLAATATCGATAADDADLLVRPDVQDWLALIDGRSDVEVQAALDVARAALRLWDTAKEQPPP